MSSTSPPAKPPRRCRDCGAVLDEAATHCWLCASKPSSDIAPTAQPDRSQSPADLNPWVVHGGIWLAIAVCALVGYGILVENGVMGLGYLIVVVPPLLITLVVSSISRAAGRPVHPAAKVALAAGIAALSVPLAVLAVVLAVIIGLFQLCTTGQSPLLDFLSQ